MMPTGDRLPPFGRLPKPTVLIKKLVAACAAQRHVIEAQQRPAKLLKFAAARATEEVVRLASAQKMPLDPRFSLNRGFGKSENFVIGSESGNSFRRK